MKQTLTQRRKLARLEKERAAAERAYKATKKLSWLHRLRELTNQCLRLA